MAQRATLVYCLLPHSPIPPGQREALYPVGANSRSSLHFLPRDRLKILGELREVFLICTLQD